MIKRNLPCAAFAVLVLALTTYSQDAPQFVRNKFLKVSEASAPLKVSPAPTVAQGKGLWRPFGPMTAASLSVCVGGSALDILSTGDGYEQNPRFRGSDGRLNKGLAIGATVAVCGGSLLFEKRWAKKASIVRFIVGGIRFGLALKNWGQR